MYTLRCSIALRAAAFPLLALASACSGSSGTAEVPQACAPEKGAGVQVIKDDRQALPVDNLVTVTRVSKDFRPLLAPVNAVTAAISPADLEAVAAASGKTRPATMKSALADLDRSAKGRGRVRLAMGSAPSQAVLTKLYGVGLEHLGLKVILDPVGDNPEVLGAARAQPDTVAVVPLTALARYTNAKIEGHDLSIELQSIATAALGKGLAVGALGQVTSGPRVAVARSLAVAQQIQNLSTLVSACGDTAVLGVPQELTDEGRSLADAYGLKTRQVDDPVRAVKEGEVIAVLLPSRRQ
jgi:hypothetical protein